MQQKLMGTRMLAGILGLFLIIALFVIWNDHQTIQKLEAPAKQNITMQRDVIREDCADTTPAGQERCADDLQQLSDLLSEFSKGLPKNTGVQTTGGQVQTSGGSFNINPTK